MRGCFHRAIVVSLVLASAEACSSDPDNAGTPVTGGNTSRTGGTSAGGETGTGGVAGAGGFQQGQGGTSSSGGARSSGGTTGAGGGTITGVAIGTGGTSRIGGATGSGGTSRTGGVIGMGGLAGRGGNNDTGGVTASGGDSNLGGAIRTGGTTGNGGSPLTGGGSGNGGVTGAGGAGNSPYKGVANSPAGEIAALGATWCYNWGTTPKASDCDDPYFVPMIWGKGDIAGAIEAIGNAGYKVVLGFNEPNKSDQANMTVAEAIALWPTLTSNPDIRVSSPAVSDDGRAWLEDFMTQANARSLRVDFIAMHWYGWNAGSCTAGQLEGAVNWASKWGLPVWITEFGCMGSSNPDEKTVLDFFNAAIPMLQKKSLVERYAWYPWNTYNHLYLEDASKVRVITALGKAFTAAPQYR